MADRKRRRTILGYSEVPCPHCGGGPLVLTSSRNRRRVRDLLNPRFDEQVVYREVCQACRMRFAVNLDARRPASRASALAGNAAASPPPLFGRADDVPDDEPVRPAVSLASRKPTQATFFTDDDELDD